MTNLSSFIKDVFGFNKKKNSMELSYDASTAETIKAFAQSHLDSARLCAEVLRYLPDISKVSNLTKEEMKSLDSSLRSVRGFYLKNKRESEDVIFWINHYMRECSKYGKASEEEGLKE